MKANTIKLPDSFVNKLINLPESGMGYQFVKVILRGGKVLRKQKVLNSELLMLEENYVLLANDIISIELDS
ncbi:MAG: hypothetical protein AB7S72_19980 [Draconibacterium sp.]